MSLVEEDTPHYPVLYEALRSTMQHCAEAADGRRVKLSDVSLAKSQEFDECRPAPYLKKYGTLVREALQLVAKQLDTFIDLPQVVKQLEKLRQVKHGASLEERRWPRFRMEIMRIVQPIMTQLEEEASARKMVMGAVINYTICDCLRDRLMIHFSTDSELLQPTSIIKACDIIAREEQVINTLTKLSKQYEAELKGEEKGNKGKPPSNGKQRGNVNAVQAKSSGKASSKDAAGMTQPRTRKTDFVPICFSCGHPRPKGHQCDESRDGPADLVAAKQARDQFMARKQRNNTGQSNQASTADAASAPATASPAATPTGPSNSEVMASLATLAQQVQSLQGQLNAAECEELVERFPFHANVMRSDDRGGNTRSAIGSGSLARLAGAVLTKRGEAMPQPILADSGADSSFCSVARAETWEQAGAIRAKGSISMRQLKGAGAELSSAVNKVHGWVAVRLVIGRYVTEAVFVVADDTAGHVILGYPTMRTWGMLIDPQRDQILWRFAGRIVLDCSDTVRPRYIVGPELEQMARLPLNTAKAVVEHSARAVAKVAARRRNLDPPKVSDWSSIGDCTPAILFVKPPVDQEPEPALIEELYGPDSDDEEEEDEVSGRAHPSRASTWCSDGRAVEAVCIEPHQSALVKCTCDESSLAEGEVMVADALSSEDAQILVSELAHPIHAADGSVLHYHVMVSNGSESPLAIEANQALVKWSTYRVADRMLVHSDGQVTASESTATNARSS